MLVQDYKFQPKLTSHMVVMMKKALRCCNFGSQRNGGQTGNARVTSGGGDGRVMTKSDQKMGKWDSPKGPGTNITPNLPENIQGAISVTRGNCQSFSGVFTIVIEKLLSCKHKGGEGELVTKTQKAKKGPFLPFLTSWEVKKTSLGVPSGISWVLVMQFAEVRL